MWWSGNAAGELVREAVHAVKERVAADGEETREVVRRGWGALGHEVREGGSRTRDRLEAVEAKLDALLEHASRQRNEAKVDRKLLREPAPVTFGRSPAGETTGLPGPARRADSGSPEVALGKNGAAPMPRSSSGRAGRLLSSMVVDGQRVQLIECGTCGEAWERDYRSGRLPNRCETCR